MDLQPQNTFGLDSTQPQQVTPLGSRIKVPLLKGFSLLFFVLSTFFSTLSAFGIPTQVLYNCGLEVEAATIVSSAALFVLTLLAIVFLAPIASHKSLRWVLLLWVIPWSWLNFHWSAAIIATLASLYSYALLFENNMHYITNNNQRDWVSILGAIFIIDCIISIFVPVVMMTAVTDSSWAEIPNFLSHGSFAIFWIIRAIIRIIAIFHLVLSPLFDGSKPSPEEKTNFSPLNKYFIGGVFCVAFGISILWLLYHNFEAVNELF